jgi:hypothetical protein
MSWKRRRDRWRKLPSPGKHGPTFGVHWGRYQKIPKVPGGPEIGLSTSGTIEESRPWSLWKWGAILVVGGIAAVAISPSLFTGLFWLALGGLLAVLTYRTWSG